MRNDTNLFESESLGPIAEFDDFDGFDSVDGLDTVDGLDGLDGFDGFSDPNAFESDLLKRAWSWFNTPGNPARGLALGAAKGAIGGAAKAGGSAIGKYISGRFDKDNVWGQRLGGAAGGAIGGALGSLADWLPKEMDYFADLAAEAEDESEAEAFLGALVPLAASLFPKAGASILKNAPQLMRGLAGTAQRLHGHPAARQLLRTSGQVMRRTGADIARHVSRGQPVTPQQASQRLAHNTYAVMRDRDQLRRALQRAQQMRQLGKN